MIRLLRALCLFGTFCCLGTAGVGAAPFTIDWSTEDDFSTPLINGQSISTFVDQQPTDTVFEFGNLFNVSTNQLGSDGHLGAAIFDSDPSGPNAGGGDPDLLVDRGNILILQNDDNPATTIDPTYGLLFDVPDDEKSADDDGSFVLVFLSPVELESIVLVDINGGVNVIVTMTDGNGLQRMYDVPQKWTFDVTVSPVGYDTLMLNTLAPQDGEGTGGDATASEDPGFNPMDVHSLEVAFLANPGTSSGGIDDIVFTVVPEPSTWTLMVMAAGCVGMVLRKRRRNHRICHRA